MADRISQVQLDRDTRVASYPRGQTALGRLDNDGALVCSEQQQQHRLCTAPALLLQHGGRRLMFSPGHTALVAARTRQQTADFKARYRAHRGGVMGCLPGA